MWRWLVPLCAEQAAWGKEGALDGWRALFLKLGSTEVLDAFLRNCVFKGKTRERNIRGGKSVAFLITGKMAGITVLVIQFWSDQQPQCS